MAYVQPLKNKALEITSYRVRWRLGGARDGEWQHERFEDEASAEIFRDAVNEGGQQWPPGWVKGKGYIDPAAGSTDEARFRFRNFARASIENRTAVEEHYRQACYRDLERWLNPTFGECDVRSVEHFSSDTVRAWVRGLEQAKVHKGPAPKNGEPRWRKMSPKTIRNLHGLLSSILEEAVKSEPPLRARNPCELTSLPRADDDGGDGAEDISFLTPDEVEGIISCLERRTDQLLVTIKYGTGMRWSEVTALAPSCLEDWQTDRPKLRVKRAWKRDGQGGYYLGTPKSKRGRRSIRVSPSVVAAVEELGGQGLRPQDRLYFTGEQQQRLHYSTMYDRWQRAVKLAKARDLLPTWHDPSLHDVRHSHAAVLLSEGRGLTYVQRRLGHESIKTTSDTYGHLLPEADDDAMDAIERSLVRAASGDDDQEVEEQVDRSRVHVAHLGDLPVAFWRAGDARAVAEQWKLDGAGRMARVESWAADWWRRQQTRGLKDVHDRLPGRVQLWSMGPAVYSGDGTLLNPKDAVHEPSGRGVWEWEEGFARTAAESRIEWREGSGETEAEVWGCDRSEVIAAYAKACVVALQMCGLNPSLAEVQGEGGKEGDQAPAGHTDS
ncbi:site-specific integrase [Streptomyces sp. NPDC047070]|uniref:tyrosine-type recombinase/integrase n=1 Tax=Streptomyces sp. NPDC047070 TaxID=3154923 RepID=UPI00345592C3